MEPEEVLARLNELFNCFHTLAENHRVEKIRRVGDLYLVAAGVPSPRDDHAKAVAAIALEMLANAEAVPLSIRSTVTSSLDNALLAGGVTNSSSRALATSSASTLILR